MWLTQQERATLAILGMLALAGFGVLAWQERRAPLAAERAADPAQAASWDEALSRARQVDVNTASVAELERLPQVGPLLARRIVEDRERRGHFARPEELARVKGIGPKTYEALKGFVTAE